MSKNVNEFLKPEEVEVKYVEDGAEKSETYTISRIPCIPAQKILFAGMEAFKSQDFNRLDYAVTQEMFKYVAHNGIVLEHEALINTHVPTPEVLIILQIKMAEKNFSFFGRENFQKHLEVLTKVMG